ncbi:mucin-2 [Venturia canescens]|uniref:mucin-2 n=1 Tax=Venturia canescens TaxID=32260 RepID=UPI001C9D36ED|nr:mucin-2 [Venturia canescens]XP_043272909.1 mucin-2 [Venturia canescens]
MSTTMRESSHVSRKYVSHGSGGGGAISGQGHLGNTSGNSLENNLDALLEDLQTSVSRSATPSRGGRARSPQVEYRSAANTSKTVTESRSLSPTHSKTTTSEKFVSTGPAGVGSGIPGLEALDAELRDVQPGQSKTVAYKQVSYQYKNVDGKPVDPYTLVDNSFSSGLPLVDDVHETSYEENRLHRRQRSPEPAVKSSSVNRELLFDESYTTSRSKQTSPLPGAQSRDLKFVRESNFQTDVRPVQTLNASQEYGTTVEYVPVPSPSPAVPINLAPGPNTKVTTTIKTYTYELPGAPESYLPGSSTTTHQKNVHLSGDQRITYTLPRGASGPIERPVSPTRYGTTTPEVTQKSKVLHKEAKYYQEEIVGYPAGGNKPTTIVYPGGGAPGTSLETTVSRNEYYRQTDGNYPPGYDHDRVDHPSGSTTTVIYQNQQQPPAPTTINETHTTTMIDRFEEHYPNRPPSAGRPDVHKPATPTRSTTVNYYTSAPPQTTPPQSNTTVYKYSNTTTVVPPGGRHPDDHEVLLPKPFPTGVQMYPSNSKPVTNGHGPPAKLEDLMASFSDSEREVLDDIAKQENYQRKDRSRQDAVSPKKEVDFAPHSPPQVQSKNIAGPPVYYPPGSAEFTKKESAEGGMSQSGGAWQKGSGKYEYEASSKSKSKSSSGKAIVPVCLPLCCGLPCVIL